MVQVGVAVKGGQIPADGLTPGRHGAGAATAGRRRNAGHPPCRRVVVAKATVFASLPDPVQAGATLLTLLVPADQAAAVAGASGAGAASLVKVPAK